MLSADRSAKVYKTFSSFFCSEMVAHVFAERKPLFVI